jgi:tripartite-type tricarboxylate transporter receptor subunit TctC
VRNRLLLSLVVAALVVAPGALAQGWPGKPIKLIVPFSAGGPTDQLSRYVGQKLSVALGQPVVVENVVGAGGVIGLERMAKSTPDGYTLATSASTLQAIAPHLGLIPYDTVKSFTPIGALAAFPYAVIVNANSPLNSVADLVARAKAKPGEVSAATPGAGTGTHLAAVLMAQRSDVQFNTVQYKGAAPIINDILGGHVDFTFEVIGSAMPLITSGKAKAIGMTGTKRHPLLPNVPTVAETLPGFDFVGWFALYGPSGLPPEITRRLNTELNKIHDSAEFRQYLETRGYQTLPGSAADLAARQQAEFVKWGEVVKKLPATAIGK